MTYPMYAEYLERQATDLAEPVVAEFGIVDDKTGEIIEEFAIVKDAEEKARELCKLDKHIWGVHVAQLEEMYDGEIYKNYLSFFYLNEDTNEVIKESK